MSFGEVVLVVGLVVVAWAFGYLKGRGARGTSSPARQEPLPMPRRAEPESPSSTTERRMAPRGEAPADPGSREVPRVTSGAAPELGAVQSWGYQLQDLDVKWAAASSFDLLVVDYSRDGTDETALTPAEVVRLQSKGNGARRVALAYLSIGEAESYRFYWRKTWSREKPAWLLKENPDWDQNYAVAFWDPEWQALLFGNPDAYLDRIIAQGFDGVYLDKCDVTEDLRRREKKAAAGRTDLDGDMVDLVQRLGAYARSKRPGFRVVMQNAETLLERAELRGAIDGVAKEELLFGLDAAERVNDAEEVDWAKKRLDLVRQEGKPVFVVEYLNNAEKIAKAMRTVAGFGYVLYVSDKNRELDKLRDPPQVA